MLVAEPTFVGGKMIKNVKSFCTYFCIIPN